MLVAHKQRDDVFHALTGMSRIALAVSGGSDSMAMLRMVHDWAPQGTTLFVLTVDHGLRDEAAAEAAKVGLWCRALGVSHHILNWQHGALQSGIQAKARAARYDLMAAWCVSHHVSTVLTGHTADDQAETVFMRQQRTQSAASLSGIWPERDWNGVSILRPLLKFRRQDLRNYLVGLGQEWIEDPSNLDGQFERVRARLALDGQLHGLQHVAERAQEQVENSQTICENWCKAQFATHETGFITLKREAFDRLNADVAEGAVRRMIDLTGSWPRKTELSEHLRLVGWLRDNGVGRRVLGGAVFMKRRDSILVTREAGRISAQNCTVPDSGRLTWDDRFMIDAPPGCMIVAAGKIAGIQRDRGLPAVVQAGLPAVLQNGVLWSVPHLGLGQKAAVKFLRR